MGIVRLLSILLALASIAIATAEALSALRQQERGPVYSVAAVRADLQRDPRSWANRIVRVRAMAELCLLEMDGPGSPCRERHPVLVDASAEWKADVLPLAVEPGSPLLAALRRLPLVGRLVLPPSTMHWGSSGIYRVQLRRLPCPLFGKGDCFEAFALDAAR